MLDASGSGLDRPLESTHQAAVGREPRFNEPFAAVPSTSPGATRVIGISRPTLHDPAILTNTALTARNATLMSGTTCQQYERDRRLAQ
jgi:hypothetical protein